jgi:hypothetical protein
MNNNIFFNKYLKYKNKYLSLKGGTVITLNSSEEHNCDCIVCYEPFNNSTKKPVLIHGFVNNETVNIDNSNHYVCLECITNPSYDLRKCPICRESPSSPLIDINELKTYDYDEAMCLIAVPIVRNYIDFPHREIDDSDDDLYSNSSDEEESYLEMIRGDEERSWIRY